jgi:hypothetical protein
MIKLKHRHLDAADAWPFCPGSSSGTVAELTGTA